MTLVELLLGIAITATLLASMTRMLASATAASGNNATQLDLQRQLQFAVQRIVLQVGGMPNVLLPAKTDDTTSVPWGLGASYVWDQTAGTVSETIGVTTHVIADSVSSFSITATPQAAGQSVIGVSMTLTKGTASASASVQTRMGSLL